MAKVFANLDDKSHIEWLQLRKSGIGGSDASGVLGVSKYSTPLTVYLDKLNLSKVGEETFNEAAHFGNVLEPVVLAEFVRRINEDENTTEETYISVSKPNCIYQSSEKEFMLANLDGTIYHPSKGLGVFEAKTAHYLLNEEWKGEDVPNAYYIQCQHNMAVMGYKYSYLAVLIGGNTFKYYYIERDQELIDMIIQIEESFWLNNVLKRVPPAALGTDAEKDVLNDSWDSELDLENVVELDDSYTGVLEQIEAYKKVIKDLQKQQTALENDVKMVMGEEQLVFVDNHKITWKENSRGSRLFKIKLNDEKGKNEWIKKIKKEKGVN